MTTFVRGRTVKTAEAVVTVDAGLAVGTHRFQLVVVTGDGRQSVPAVVDVVVSRRLVIDPLEPPVTRPPVIPPVRPPVTRPPVTPLVTDVVRPPVTPIVTPIRTPAKPRKAKAAKATRRKPAKPRSEP